MAGGHYWVIGMLILTTSRSLAVAFGPSCWEREGLSWTEWSCSNLTRSRLRHGSCHQVRMGLCSPAYCSKIYRGRMDAFLEVFFLFVFTTLAKSFESKLLISVFLWLLWHNFKNRFLKHYTHLAPPTHTQYAEYHRGCAK